MKFDLKNIKNLFKTSKNIGNKISKSTFYVIFDMFKCYSKYGANVKNYVNSEFYLMNDKERNTFLTDKYEDMIINKYNDKVMLNKLYDRIYFNQLFKDYINRDYIDLRDVSFKDFKEFIMNRDAVVVNCVKGKSNREIISINKELIKNEYNVLKLYNSIVKKEQFLVMDIVSLNKSLVDLCGRSELQVITFLNDKMECTLLNVLVKADNMHAFVNESGEVFTPFITEESKVVCKSRVGNKDVLGFKVPFYNDIFKLVREIVKKVPDNKYLVWNINVTDKGLCLEDIEEFPNLKELKPSVLSVRKGSLDKYKKYMDI